MASLLGRSLVSVALRRSFSTLVKPTLTSCSRIPAIRCALPSQTTRVDVRFGGGGVDYEAKPVASFKRGDYEYHAVKLLKAFGNVDAEKVTLDAHFEKDLGLNILDRVELLLIFEDHFFISFPDHIGENIFTLRQIVEHAVEFLEADLPDYIYPHRKAQSDPEV